MSKANPNIEDFNSRNCPICNKYISSIRRLLPEARVIHLKNEHPRAYEQFTLKRALANQHKLAIQRLNTETARNYGISINDLDITK